MVQWTGQGKARDFQVGGNRREESPQGEGSGKTRGRRAGRGNQEEEEESE